jgi:hypothetical protein
MQISCDLEFSNINFLNCLACLLAHSLERKLVLIFLLGSQDFLNQEKLAAEQVHLKPPCFAMLGLQGLAPMLQDMCFGMDSIPLKPLIRSWLVIYFHRDSPSSLEAIPIAIGTVHYYCTLVILYALYVAVMRNM